MHAGSIAIAGFLCLILICAIVFFTAPKHLLSRCTALRGGLQEGRLDSLAEYVHGIEDEEFWRDSRGLAGVIKRLHDMAIIVCLLQVSVANGYITFAAASEVYNHALVQIYFSLWAVPEAALCIAWHHLPHLTALGAFRSHYALTLRASNLCYFDGAPPGISTGGRLL